MLWCAWSFIGKRSAKNCPWLKDERKLNTTKFLPVVFSSHFLGRDDEAAVLLDAGIFDFKPLRLRRVGFREQKRLIFRVIPTMICLDHGLVNRV